MGFEVLNVNQLKKKNRLTHSTFIYLNTPNNIEIAKLLKLVFC